MGSSDLVIELSPEPGEASTKPDDPASLKYILIISSNITIQGHAIA
jgi:hypothetical protein